MFELPEDYWPALGARAVACPLWAWVPEMSTLAGDPVVAIDGALFVRQIQPTGTSFKPIGPHHLPLLQDELTCDRLLDRVRVVRGDPRFDVHRPGPPKLFVPLAPLALVACWRWRNHDDTLLFRTRGEAILAALESATITQ